MIILQELAKEANRELKGTGLIAVIDELSEPYDVIEDKEYYGKPQYDGYIEDAEENEVGERTGCYCEVNDVVQELLELAKEIRGNYNVN